MSAFDLRTETPHRRAISLPFVDQEARLFLPRFDRGRHPPWHRAAPCPFLGKPVSSMIHASIGPWRSISGSTNSRTLTCVAKDVLGIGVT